MHIFDIILDVERCVYFVSHMLKVPRPLTCAEHHEEVMHRQVYCRSRRLSFGSMPDAKSFGSGLRSARDDVGQRNSVFDQLQAAHYNAYSTGIKEWQSAHIALGKQSSKDPAHDN